MKIYTSALSGVHFLVQHCPTLSCFHFRTNVPLLSNVTPFGECIGLPMATVSMRVRSLLPASAFNKVE